MYELTVPLLEYVAAVTVAGNRVETNAVAAARFSAAVDSRSSFALAAADDEAVIEITGTETVKFEPVTKTSCFP